MKEYALKGVKTYEIKVLPDERGFFSEVLRTDWKEFLEDEQITQINLSYSYPNIVRAWHKHIRGQIDHFLVIQGALKICAYEEETGKMVEVVSSSKKPTVVRIPGKYFHGIKAVSNEPAILIYFVNRLYDYKNPDELRRPWNDQSIVPTEINGNKNDPRVGKPWDWFRAPYK
jgi:dTDP-4-dehydrorhamnose 3,5-epimerase